MEHANLERDARRFPTLQLLRNMADYDRYTYIACTCSHVETLLGRSDKPQRVEYAGKIGSLADEHLFSVPKGNDEAAQRTCTWLADCGARNVKVQIPKARTKRQ